MKLCGLIMNCRAIKKHRSTYPNPIEFEVNDLLETGSEDDEYPGWVWVRLGDGNEGWAPKEYIEILDDSKTGIAKSKYCARELDIEVGDYLQIENSLCGWHYVINVDGETGWVPQECIQFT